MKTDTINFDAKQQIIQVLSLYDLGTLESHKDWSFGYANKNYKVTTTRGNYFYRTYLKQPLEVIEYEMSLMKALKTMQFPTAYPIAQKDGNLIYKGNGWNVVIYEFKQGGDPELNLQTVTITGQAIGKLSLFPDAQNFIRHNPLNLKMQERLMADFENAKNPIPVLLDYFVEQTEYLRPFLAQSLPSGIIHGDCFPDNTVFVGNKLAAIVDFEMVCYDHLLFDVGMTIIGFCFVNNALDLDLLTAFLTAYHQQRPFTPEEWELILVYIQWSVHCMVGWHLDNNLLHKHNERQWQRVQMHLAKVKHTRKNETEISKHIARLAQKLKK